MLCPTLAMPNWSQPFIIDIDATDTGVGAVLSQVDQEGIEHVIAYGSHVLSKTECNYCASTVSSAHRNEKADLKGAS